MTELIDIWEAIELLSDKRSDCNFFVDGQTAYEALSDMIQAVKELPRIDLVRCKDCKHYDTESRTFPCCTDIFGAVRYMEADGFCSKGERRADDNTIKADK